MAKSKHFYIRKAHRYLGLILGIQFLLWAIGGLYFSWSNIDEIHGDFQKKQAPLLASDIKLVSPSVVMDTIKKVHKVDSLVTIQLIEILGKPYYQVRCMSGQHDMSTHTEHMDMMNHLANAETGELRGPLTKEEAIKVAAARFNGMPELKSVEYITAVNKHHEYRENPLPAYAVTFNHPTNTTTVYVSSELGTVQKFRNNKWRIFDFLYMMHTMDYQSRDDFNNLLIRIFSVFGIITILSGFILFVVSSKWFRKKRNSATGLTA
ncbi:MAG: PepSY domain-containing protein [Sphingobacteriales bacterium]|nr:PepSY domain-containing protein [Sphingobacteriales bacterium]MBI3720434.1 PepSY domain-containing protein [Sphingobacteriales bacterium]